MNLKISVKEWLLVGMVGGPDAGGPRLEKVSPGNLLERLISLLIGDWHGGLLRFVQEGIEVEQGRKALRFNQT